MGRNKDVELEPTKCELCWWGERKTTPFFKAGEVKIKKDGAEVVKSFNMCKQHYYEFHPDEKKKAKSPPSSDAPRTEDR